MVARGGIEPPTRGFSGFGTTQAADIFRETDVELSNISPS